MNETSVIEKPKDKWARIIFIPLMGFISTLLFERQRTGGDSNFIYINIVISILSTFLFWEGNRAIVIRLRQRFPLYNQVAKRLFWQILLCTAFSVFTSNFIFYTLTNLFPDVPLCKSDRLYMSQLSLILTYLVIAVYESTYFFGKWKATLVHAEELKRESVEAQFESLKNQVNPHFLFNSLNTLTALIEENPSLAVRYVNQLSQVYRYVLQSREKEVTNLKTELEFTTSYIFLLQKRFEQNLNFIVTIEEKYLSKKIAPLCLQMLIENAIKHNIVSSERPLNIHISIENENYITVINNLQLKNFPDHNTGIGLPNIVKRYSYLSESEVKIDESKSFFKVSLPLI